MTNIIEWICACCIRSDKEKRRAFWPWALALFIGGGYLWGKFINWGLGPYSYHDWAEITLPRLTFLSNAIRQGAWPLHLADSLPLGGVTDRFLAIPDVLLSPQVFLLGWLEPGQFILVNFWLLYAVGFAGLAWFARRRRLSIAAFSLLFLVFNFNGHLLAHISVGHYTWTAWFLFPWLFGLIFQLKRGKGGWPWVLKVALVLFAMELQGGYHQFIWSLFLLALLIPVYPRHFWTLVKALAAGVLVNAARLLPLALNLGKFDNKFIAGFPFVQTVMTALTGVYVPNDYTIGLGLTGQIGTWEYTAYTGVLGAALVVWFGLIAAYRSRRQPGNFSELLFPVIGLALLSMDWVYRNLRLVLPLPIFTGERVSSRILGLALLLALFLAVIEVQRWLGRQNPTPALVLSALGGLGLVANDLWQNFQLWNVRAAAPLYGDKILDPARWAIANHADAQYTLLLAVGVGISLVSWAALIALARKKCSPAQAHKSLPRPSYNSSRTPQAEIASSGMCRTPIHHQSG